MCNSTFLLDRLRSRIMPAGHHRSTNSAGYPEMSWRSNDDFIKTISNYSYNDDQNSKEPPPPTIMEWRARREGTNSIYDYSIYDNLPLANENVTYVSTGRGKGSFKTFRPGFPNSSTYSDEDLIRKKLTEVNGIGYSNEAIKEHICRNRNETENNIKEFCDARENVGYSNSPSQFFTPESSTSKSDTLSQSSSPGKLEKEEIVSGGSKSNSPAVMEKPLPLSQMLQLGRRRKEVQKPQNEITEHFEIEEPETNDFWWNNDVSSRSSSGSNTEDYSCRTKSYGKTYNINCSKDFPSLT